MGTAYAVTDEIHQFFVPERACAVTDMLIDSAGVAAGAMILILILIYKARRK
jgi:VanZ family protein